MIRILYVATESALGMIPFATTIVNTISKAQWADVYVVALNSDNLTYKGNFTISSDKVFYLQSSRRPFYKVLNKFYPVEVIKCIRKICLKYKIDIIHYLTGDFSMALYNVFHVNKKHVYTVHDLFPHEIEKMSLYKNIIRKIILMGNKINLNYINNLTTSSVMQYNYLKDKYIKKNVFFTHFPTLVTNKVKEGRKLVPELIGVDDYILFFGNINKYKGVDLLIDAYNKSKILQTKKLVIAGCGIKYITNNENIITINRYIDDTEIADLFKSSSFVVYPYRSATMSGVLSLAFYFKKRVILSSIPFFKQFECLNVMYFKTENILDLKNKMEIISTNKSTVQSSYNDFFSDDQLIDDYYDLYNYVIK